MQWRNVTIGLIMIASKMLVHIKKREMANKQSEIKEGKPSEPFPKSVMIQTSFSDGMFYFLKYKLYIYLILIL